VFNVWIVGSSGLMSLLTWDHK